MAKNYRQLLEQRKGQRKQIELNLLETEQNLDHLKAHREDLEKAQAIIQLVAKETQSQLRYRLSELVTLALESVFDDPPEFDVEFVPKNNQTEAELWFIRNGEKIKPIDSSGGGMVDVAAFALKVSIWSMKSPRTRPIMILDEPFRFVSMAYRPAASEMLKLVSEKLGLQIIMVTHDEALIEKADRVISVSQKRGISRITIS